jgi:hypothetical protein
VGIARIAKAYPGWDERTVRDFLREHHASVGRRWEYDTATGFRVPETRGRYVNVHAAGFRTNGTAQPWPPSPANFNVFVFGGSTAFGFALPDDQTIAAHLQRALASKPVPRSSSEFLGSLGDRPVPPRNSEELPRNSEEPVSVHVYNFGVPGFFSSQERARFEDLLVRGHRPDVAIFIDGLNEFWGDSLMTAQLRHGLDQVTNPNVVRRTIFFLRAMPLADLARRFASRPGALPVKPDCRKHFERWLANRRLIAASGVRTIFVWQPVATYRYDLRHHAFADLTTRIRHIGQCYAELPRFPDGVLRLDGLQADRRENLYVDAGHYNAAFSADIARAIAVILSRRSGEGSLFTNN